MKSETIWTHIWRELVLILGYRVIPSAATGFDRAVGLNREIRQCRDSMASSIFAREEYYDFFKCDVNLQYSSFVSVLLDRKKKKKKVTGGS